MSSKQHFFLRMLFASPSYRWENRSTEMLNDFPEVRLQERERRHSYPSSLDLNLLSSRDSSTTSTGSCLQKMIDDYLPRRTGMLM